MPATESVKQWFIRKQEKFTLVRIPQDRTDVDYDPEPFSKNTSYCRVWLVEMGLENGSELFKKRYPVVYSSVRFLHGGEEISIPAIAGPDYLKTRTRDNFHRILYLNTPLTPLFPYTTGLVEIQAGLFSMISTDWVKHFVNTLDQLSKMVRVPELSTVVKFAKPVCSGMDNLLGTGDGRLEIGYQQALSGAEGLGNRLTPGYFAVIRAEPEQLADQTFTVAEERLHVAKNGESEKPGLFSGFSYMLFRIEKQADPEWEHLKKIMTLANRAIDAANSKKKKDLDTLEKSLKLEIATSPDILPTKRAGAWENIKKYIEDCTLHGASPYNGATSLYTIMKQGIPPTPETESEIRALRELFDLK